MKYVPLTRGFVAKVDDADYERVMRRSWCVLDLYEGKGPGRSIRSTRYATTTAVKGERTKMVLLHRFILRLGAGRSPVVDHKNGDGLDCRRANLRVCSQSENIAAGRGRPNKHGIRGVYYDTRYRLPWHVSIHRKVEGRRQVIFRGRFATKEEAHAAWAKVKRERFGEFARVD